ncbi:MAG TPA: substrate-binding domain-containing protein [Chitinophagaceae bacterium]|nr:substrate-binding domain-containing protein [Chitinophagaceae bacterium]
MSWYNRILKQGLLVCGIIYLLGSCNGPNQRTDTDTPEKGTIHISVDESFKPVIDSQIQVFEALYPGAKVIAEYKPEAECFRDLIKDSTRMIIVTRGLTQEEEKFYKDSLKYGPTWSKVANDAVTLVVNNRSADTIITMDKIRGILDGTTGDKEIAVFDGLSATSTVRFAVDSILKGKSFDPKKVFAVKSSQEVINYVSTHDNAIGFVGVSWIGNKEDTAQLSFLKKVKIAALECNCPEKSFVKPYQYNILSRRYPLVRGLYYILKENYDGLGSGFANFMEYEKGQLIFWRAYLGPSKMRFDVRSATTN